MASSEGAAAPGAAGLERAAALAPPGFSPGAAPGCAAPVLGLPPFGSGMGRIPLIVVRKGRFGAEYRVWVGGLTIAEAERFAPGGRRLHASSATTALASAWTARTT